MARKKKGKGNKGKGKKKGGGAGGGAASATATATATADASADASAASAVAAPKQAAGAPGLIPEVPQAQAQPPSKASSHDVRGEEEEKKQAAAAAELELGGPKDASAVLGSKGQQPQQKQKQVQVIDGQSHEEMHLRPSEAVAACDGDDSASRSGSETDEGAAMIDVAGSMNGEPKEEEHVLFEEDGAVEAEEEEVGGRSNAVGAACKSWESARSSDQNLVGMASRHSRSQSQDADAAATGAGASVDASGDMSGDATPKVRPAKLVPPMQQQGGPDGDGTALVGGGASLPPMPVIALTEPAPTAVLVGDRRISDVSEPNPLPSPLLDTRLTSDETPRSRTVTLEGTMTATESSFPVMPVVGDLTREMTEPHANNHQPRMSPERTTVVDAAGAPPLPPPTTPPAQSSAAAADATTPKTSSTVSPPRQQHAPSPAGTATTTHTAEGRIHLGICAMDKKARSKPMGEILSRLDETLFEVVFFGDELILNADVEEWPIVDVLIAFYSSGYPLAKAEAYVKLRRPFVLNDLNMQWTLKDRRRVYDLLKSSGIDVPRHVYMSRDGYVSTETTGAGADNNEDGDAKGDGDLIEHDDHIEVNGVIINKPFVEKPVDADDHNIAIYYPSSAGGGCKKLFRKVGDRSSEFYSDINEVRRDGSYIYEEFVETQGTDVKMYTVGPDYGHAEARKSPTVDGKVERNSDGKEVRFPVILTLREKEIARRIVIRFKQQVCGFDLLRVQEGDSLVSYVCDVNGWSFVKNSRKYYDDCAQILTEHMLAAVKPNSLSCFSALDPLLTTIADIDMGRPDTPKKPMRKTTSAMQRVSRMLQGEMPLTPKDSGPPSMSPARLDGDASVASLTPALSAPTTLEEGAIPVSQIPHQLATNPPSIVTSAASSVNGDDESLTREPAASTHKEELRCVIAVVRHGDRTPKQKLKLNISEPRVLQFFEEHCESPKKDLKVKAKKPMEAFLKTIILMISEKEAEAKALGTKRHLLNNDGQILYKLRHMRDVLQRWKIGGLNRKLQIKPRKWDEVEVNGLPSPKCTEVQLILKWGGNLTKLGERQSINLGQRLRHELYPDAPGGGILRLHSTFRHDLKIKTSDEGRVMKTAAASAKGLLELEGEIPPILVSLVHKEKDSIHMLDPSGNKEVKKELEECKKKINANLQKDFDFDKTTVEEHEDIVGPATLVSLHKALQEVHNPRKTMFEIRSTMGELLEQLDEMLGLMTSGDESRNEGGEGLRGEGEGALSGIKLYKGETLLELTERWRLLYRKFYDEDKDVFDLSRVPDVHDNVRFDMLHNPHLGLTATLEKLYNMAKVMADCVVPQEYGSTILEKRSIGQKMCRALLDKIKYDLIIARTDNQVDMRYMINMDYSADLPINTMGRRIRTRLYFTSESHLHTLLNVLRFTSDDPLNDRPLLSKRGRQIVDETPELCYLTQVVFRLFEDPKKDISDPKRFRIEVFFSPGATATPLHMAEMDRDLDNSRFETDPLQLISKENLSCSELEDYFSEAIKEGKTDEDDDASIISTAASMEDKKKKKEKEDKKSEKEAKKAESSVLPTLADVPSEDAPEVDEAQIPVAIIEEKKTAEIAPPTVVVPSATDEAADDPGADVNEGVAEQVVKSRGLDFSEEPGEPGEGECEREVVTKNETENEDNDRLERMARILEKKYFWTSVAAITFVMGVGCLLLSRSMGNRPQRRWSRR